MELHNKIINDVANKILKPEGLFRIGSSRKWIEDNGYYFTIVEFQPSSYLKGSYLNAGLDFLWEMTDDLNNILKYDLGGRIIIEKGTQFIEYRPELKNCEKLFTLQTEEFAGVALENVKEYRKFRDLGYAKKMLVKKAEETLGSVQCWELYQLSMLCFFKGDYKEGKEYFDEYLNVTKNSFYIGNTYIEWKENFYNYCITEMIPELESADTAQQMVFDMINRRRAVFAGKSSYKKMKKDLFYNKSIE